MVAAGVQLDILNIWYSDFHNPPVGCMNGYYSLEEKAQRLTHIRMRSLVIVDPYLYPREIHLPAISPTGGNDAQLNDRYILIPSADIPGSYVYRVREDLQIEWHFEPSNDGYHSDDDVAEYNKRSLKDVEEHIKRTCVYYNFEEFES